MGLRRVHEKPSFYIFHLSRAGVLPLFLHTLKTGKDLIRQVEDSTLRGRYGKEPRVESLTLLRADLYRAADNAVREWVFELRFAPRFLMCAGVFLVVYFFMSFVVRDPLPMIDEILGGFGAALAVWFLIGKRFLSSRAAEETRNGLYTRVDGIAFEESGFVQKMEETLAGFDAAGNEKLLEIYNAACGGKNPGGEEFSAAGAGLCLLPEWEEEAAAFESCLDAFFQGKGVKDFRKRLRKKAGFAPRADKALDALCRLIAAARIDFPLFVLHRVLRGSGAL